MKTLFGFLLAFSLFAFSQQKDTIIKYAHWPNEAELKTWLSTQFPSRPIAIVHKDTVFGFYTYVESIEVESQKTVSIQQSKKFWHRVDVKLMNEMAQISISKSGVQNQPDVNTPNPEIVSLESLNKQLQKRFERGKDVSAFQKQIESLEESRFAFFDKVIEWLVAKD